MAGEVTNPAFRRNEMELKNLVDIRFHKNYDLESDGLYIFLHGTNEERSMHGAVTREATPTIMVWRVEGGRVMNDEWFDWSEEGLSKAEEAAKRLGAEFGLEVKSPARYTPAQ
jgi:hypothetical protein